MRDTTTAAEQVRLRAIRALQPADRLRQVIDISESVRVLAFARLRARYPDHSDLDLVELYLRASFEPMVDRKPHG